MRLHILQDQKIINRTIKYFELVFPQDNKYIVLFTPNKAEVTHVKEDSSHNVYCLKYGTDKFWEVVGDIKQYDKIIIHYLFGDAIPFVNSISHPEIYWIEWGGDLYHTLLYRKGFPLYKDERLVARMTHPKVPYFIYKIIINRRVENDFRRMNTAIKKIKYFVPDSMEDEYEMLLSQYPEYSFLQLKEFFYYPIQEILGDLYSQTTKGRAFFIGNSCSFTNNHPYVLSKLSKIRSDSKVIVPISYSGNNRYRNYIQTIGKDLFGDRFCPILNYMPLDDYNNLFIQSGFFFFGNLRQEAVGNILIALYLGGKVFLEKQNPLLAYYKRKGLVLFSMDDVNEKELGELLDKDSVKHNREILDLMYSNERMQNLIAKSF